MGAAAKIMRGLQEALTYSRCRHEFTYWEPHGIVATGIIPLRQWSRTCTKCKGHETRTIPISEPDPTN